jgi:hypothetical protein
LTAALIADVLRGRGSVHALASRLPWLERLHELATWAVSDKTKAMFAW